MTPINLIPQQLQVLLPTRPKTAKKKTARDATGAATAHTPGIVFAALSHAPSFIPKEVIRKHRYVENFIITSGSAGVLGTSYDYAMTGLYDPYLGAGGHQPYGFDEMAPLYGTYTVTSVSLRITYAVPSDGATYLVVGWRPTNSSFSITGLGVSDVCEKDSVAWFPLPSVPARIGDSTIDLGHFPIHKVEGRTPAQILAEQGYSGTAAANPANVPRFMISSGNLAGASATTCALVIQLEYTTVWRAPNIVGQS